jgi:hypothetical protein
VKRACRRAIGGAARLLPRVARGIPRAVAAESTGIA